MRKNTLEVFKAWTARESCKPCRSIWTDGEKIYSYDVSLLEWQGLATVGLNVAKYSPTTSNKQNSLRVLCRQSSLDVNLIGG